MSQHFPKRIVCLTEETTEIVFALGAGDRVVGVSGYAVRPAEAREKPKVGAFTSIRMEKIREVNPDLIITFSDLQAQIAHDLVKAGYTVLALNQRSVEETFQAIELVGRVIGELKKAEEMILGMKKEMDTIHKTASRFSRRPRVYFEEWDNPLITGIRWVSELIDIAGGEETFPEMKERKNAPERVIQPEDVIQRNPDIIFASWCGKKANLAAIKSRPGWDKIEAVKNNQLFEIKSPDILAPGPSFLLGLRQMHEAIKQMVDCHPGLDPGSSVVFKDPGSPLSRG